MAGISRWRLTATAITWRLSVACLVMSRHPVLAVTQPSRSPVPSTDSPVDARRPGGQLHTPARSVPCWGTVLPGRSAFTTCEAYLLWPKRLSKLLAEAIEGSVAATATGESLASRFKPA